MRRDYADFDLVFHRDEAGSYSVEVSNSPVGEAARSFEVPFSDQDLEIFLLRMGHARGSNRRVDTPELQATRSFGRRLYGAVFGGRVGTLLERSLDEADRNEQGLRVRLHLSETPELADLPWEFVYSEELGRFLATSTETPVVRYMDLPRRVRPLTISPPLRILVMISSPSDHTPLNVDAEWRRLKAALHDLGNRGLVELSKVQDGSVQSLQQELRRDEYHVLHFIGHGAFDETIDDGVLILEDERQRGRRVGGEDLGMILHDHRSLRLAVLNSCEGARSSRIDPFSGTGKSLVQQGIPAVVAMQFEISDEAAIQFAREFYEALADGYPVDAAMGEARKALFGGGIEWGTPVLYMRAPDGRIFDIEDSANVVDESLPETRRAVDTRRVAQLFGMARTSMDEEDWSTAVSRLEDVVRLDPTHAGALESLESARARERIARMYGGARLLFEAGQWQAVVDRVEQIRLVEPAFDDPDELELRARNTLVEEERAARLAEWYRDATTAFEAAEWEASMELLGRIAAESSNYKDTQEILTQASAHHQSEQLLAEAGEAIEGQRWQAAIDRFTEMELLGTDYVQDPHGWRQLAIDRIAEQQQERRLDALYDTALALVEGEGWDEASKIIDKIESERPGYRGIDRFRTRIKEAHARLVEEERLREVEHEPVEEALAEVAPAAEAPMVAAPVEEEPSRSRRRRLLTVGLAVVGALAMLVFLVVPGLSGDGDDDSAATPATMPAASSTGGDSGAEPAATAEDSPDGASSDGSKALPAVVGEDPSDRVIALYFSAWEAASVDTWCCEYFPQHVVHDWGDSGQLVQHFAWLRQARVGVIGYEWSGRGSSSDVNLPAVLDAADRYGVEVAFSLEPHQGRSATTLADDVSYIYGQYGQHPAFHWVIEPTRWQQDDNPKGLFLLRETMSGPQGTIDDPTYWEPAVTAIHHLANGGIVLGDVDPEWIDPVGFDGLTNYVDPVPPDLSWAKDLPDGAWYVPTVIPGWEPPSGDGVTSLLLRSGGDTYDERWEAVLSGPVRPNRVIIGSFNDWGVGTQIAPVATGVTNDEGFTHRDYGDVGPEHYLDLTAHWVAEFLERFP